MQQLQSISEGKLVIYTNISTPACILMEIHTLLCTVHTLRSLLTAPLSSVHRSLFHCDMYPCETHTLA